MNKTEVAALIGETEKQLKAYLEDLAAGRSFDMSGFEKMALRIQEEISALNPLEASAFKHDMATLMGMLDKLQDGLEARRDSVRNEIEGLNRRIDANKAYRQTEIHSHKNNKNED